MFDYPVTLTKQPEGGYVVTFPDVPEAITQADDKEGALLRAVDALETALTFYVNAKEQLPTPSATKGATVRPAALECAKLGLYKLMKQKRMKKAELARLLGWHMPQVDRLFDLNHSSKFEQIEAAANALNARIEIDLTSSPT